MRLCDAMLPQRLHLFCDSLPQIALVLAQHAAARRGTRLEHGRTGRSLHCWLERRCTRLRGSRTGSITGRGAGSGTGLAMATVSLLPCAAAGLVVSFTGSV